MINEIILFEDINFRGPHVHIFINVGNLGDFNDEASSAVVKRGNWKLYEHANFSGHSVELGPGIYPNLHTFQMGDRASSVRM